MCSSAASCTRPALQEPRQPLQPLGHVGLVDDSIPPIHRFRLVPGDLHGDGAGDSSALQIADGRPPEVMEQSLGAARLPARDLPRLGEGPDLPTVSVENEGDDALAALLGFYCIIL